MKWKKGQSGNPNGRPKDNWKAMLDKAIRAEGEKRGITPFERLAALFFESRDAALGISNYYIPKLRTVEAKIDGESPFKLIISLPSKVQDQPKQLPETMSLPVVSREFTPKQTVDIEPKTKVEDDKSISDDNK